MCKFVTAVFNFSALDSHLGGTNCLYFKSKKNSVFPPKNNHVYCTALYIQYAFVSVVPLHK